MEGIGKGWIITQMGNYSWIIHSLNNFSVFWRKSRTDVTDECCLTLSQTIGPSSWEHQLEIHPLGLKERGFDCMSATVSGFLLISVLQLTQFPISVTRALKRTQERLEQGEQVQFQNRNMHRLSAEWKCFMIFERLPKKKSFKMQNRRHKFPFLLQSLSWFQYRPKFVGSA